MERSYGRINYFDPAKYYSNKVDIYTQSEVDSRGR